LTPENRQLLADVLAAISGAPGAQWITLAVRLADRFPARWGSANQETVSAQCRALGVPTVNVRAGRRVRKGCRRADVEAALAGTVPVPVPPPVEVPAAVPGLPPVVVHVHVHLDGPHQ
jgi:hypothetical protein